MRTPSEYIAAAMAGLRGSLMPDCSATLRHGGDVATVTRVGSPSLGADALTDASISVGTRILASAADFPRMKIGEAVELDESLRVVVSASTDPTRTSLSIGLSEPFEDCAASYSGTRRENGAVRTISASYNVLTLRDGTAEAYADAIAPSYTESYLVGVRRSDWTDETDPETGDSLTIAPHGSPVAVKVSTVSRYDGWYILKCRARS